MSAAEIVRDAAEPLPEIDDPGFADAFERFAGARIVLLGEASHGTSEFYRARATITRRLIERHGFTIVAVEADWPDAAAIDRYVRGRLRRGDADPPFQRFPTWMWRNREVAEFTRWLKGWNAERGMAERAGFFGLDLYNMAGSIAAVIGYLESVDPDAAAHARERYACLAPFSRDPARYGRLSVHAGYAKCEQPVIDMLTELFAKAVAYGSLEDDAFLDAAQNARLVANAEAYYRAMYFGPADSWNLRDEHMADTLDLLLAAKSDESKAVVWAHNSHIGDARATDMGRQRGELNLGQLCRERHGEAVRLIGFGTHTGTVAAASDWDAPMEVKRVNPSLPDSYERVCHDAGAPRFLLDLRDGPAREVLMAERLERFIGVIYRPETERWSHYAEAQLPLQLDAWVWFDETGAVTPLTDDPGRDGAEETWPFGL